MIRQAYVEITGRGLIPGRAPQLMEKASQSSHTQAQIQF